MKKEKSLAMAMVLFAALFMACPEPVPYPVFVANPTANYSSGVYAGTINVELSTSTPGATIRYTLDDSNPSKTNGTIYSGAIPLSSTTQIKAFAYKADSISSSSVTFNYTLHEVYIAGGYSASSSPETYTARFWKNDHTGGFDFRVTGTDKARHARDILVDNGYVYTAGNYGSNDRATYWKNAVNATSSTNRTDLQDSSYFNHDANAIAVNGSTVYTVGYANDEDRDRAAIWTGTSSTLLNDGLNSNHNSYANDIYLDGSTRYIAGNVRLGSALSVADVNAVYWQNTTRYNLPSTNASFAMGITRMDGTVYTVGNQKSSVGASNSTAILWINQNAPKILDSSNSSFANKVVHYDGDIYIVGSVYRNNNMKACYWVLEDGLIANLSDPVIMSQANTGYDESYGDDITVVDGYVYVAGTEIKTGSTRAVYWVNGEPGNRIYPDTAYSYARGIDVVAIAP
jgi:hypothetical protein